MSGSHYEKTAYFKVVSEASLTNEFFEGRVNIKY